MPVSLAFMQFEIREIEQAASQLGYRLQALREQRKLAPQQICTMSGINLQQLASWEIGITSPDALGILRLCWALNVTPNELFDLEKPPSIAAPVPNTDEALSRDTNVHIPQSPQRRRGRPAKAGAK